MYAVGEGLIHFICAGIICCINDIIGQLSAADVYYPLKVFAPCDDTCHRLNCPSDQDLLCQTVNRGSRASSAGCHLVSQDKRICPLTLHAVMCTTSIPAVMQPGNDEVKHVWATSLSALVQHVTCHCCIVLLVT